MLLAHADAVFTLTPGAAEAVARDYGVRALVVPHPHIVPLDRIAAHLGAHGGYVSWSGGKDSTVVLDLARQADPQVPVCFFDSGIEFPETLDYVAELTALWGLNLHTYTPSPSVLEILVASGQWDHHAELRPTPDLFRAAMLEPARVAHEHHGPGLLWGVRSGESKGRRMGYARALAAVDCAEHATPASRRRHHGGVISRQDGTVVYGPIWDWHTDQVWTYLAGRDIPPNPVYAKLTKAGAPPHAQRLEGMVAVAGIDNGSLLWLKRGWPDEFERLAQVLPRMRDYT